MSGQEELIAMAEAAKAAESITEAGGRLRGVRDRLCLLEHSFLSPPAPPHADHAGRYYNGGAYARFNGGGYDNG
eukprot:2382519-Rhodomonas_salina.1